MEEVKNLLILRFIDVKEWDWSWALHQFRSNRLDLKEKERRVGFSIREPTTNGHN